MAPNNFIGSMDFGSETRQSTATPHAIYGASGMSIWSNCPGMFGLLGRAQKSGAVPTQDSGSHYAREGTMAHDAGEKVLMARLKGFMGTSASLSVPFDVLDIDVPDAIEDKADFQQAVLVYVEECRSIITQANRAGSRGVHVGLETTFDLNAIYDMNDWMLPQSETPESMARKAPLFGTGDFWFFADGRLTLIDYKHGAGVPVPAETIQLKYYALGALLRMEALGETVDLIDVCVVQPRAPGEAVKWAHYNRDEILMEFGMELVGAVLRTWDDDAELKAGAWCRFCKAAAAPCPKLAEQARAIAKKHFDVIEPGAEIKVQPQALDAAELAEALNGLPLLQEFIKNVQRAATSRLSRGEQIPGYKPVVGRTHRKWDDEAAVLRTASNNLAVGAILDTVAPRKVLSVAQMEKLAKSNMAVDGVWSHLSSHITQPDGSVTYAAEDDPRPAVTSAQKSFDPI